MTSLQEIEVALKVRVLQQRVGRLESACRHKDVAGMLSAVSDVEAQAQTLRDMLQSVYDSAEHMNGGPHDAVEGTPVDEPDFAD